MAAWTSNFIVYFYNALDVCCGRLDLKLYCLLLQCSGRVQSKNGVDLVEVSIFYYKSEKMSGQTVRPINSSVFLSYHHLVFKLLFLAFTMLWPYPVQNEVALLEVSNFQKLDGGVKKFGRPRSKSTLSLQPRSNFYHGIYNALDIFSPKIKTLSQW